MMPLYQYVALRAALYWNKNGNCGLVVGATYPEELKSVQDIAPATLKLIPGIGKQGGDLERSVLAARNPEGRPFLINVSSGITFASPGEDFAEAAGNKLDWYTDEINRILATEPAAT